MKYRKENKRNIIKEIFDLSCDNDKVKIVSYNNDEYVEYLCYFFFFLNYHLVLTVGSVA